MPHHFLGNSSWFVLVFMYSYPTRMKGVKYMRENKSKNKTYSPVVNAFKNAHQLKDERDWDTLYILLDIHGTVMYSNHGGVSTEFYPHALDVLKHLSKDKTYKIIMWTCSTQEHRDHYKELLSSHGVNVHYVNANPEVASNTGFGDFTGKLYCNILLDDKAGHDFEVEWMNLKKFLNLDVDV